MKLSTYYWIYLFVLLGFSSLSYSFDFKPQVSITKLEQGLVIDFNELNTLNTQTLDYTSNFYAASLAGTFVFNKRFALSASALVTSEIDSTDNINDLAINAGYTELNASLGVRFFKGVRVFVGGRLNQFDVTGVLPIYLRDEGPYAGVSTGVAFGNFGVLSLRAAVAQQTGRIEGLPVAEPNNNLQFNDSSGPNGVSLGASWNGKIDYKLGYTLSLDYRTLEFHLQNVSSSDLVGQVNQQQILFTLSIRGI